MKRTELLVAVIDGQGGGMGRALTEAVKKNFPDLRVRALGTNALATAAMLKGGAMYGATGENPVVVACRDADVIIGPVGIISADSMLGEITPAMALAVAQSPAKRVLLPLNRCDNISVGVSEHSLGGLVQEAVDTISRMA